MKKTVKAILIFTLAVMLVSLLGATAFASDGISGDTELYSSVGFWIWFCAIAFVLPTALGILGIVLARAEKTHKCRYWYIVSAASFLWMLLGAMLTVLFATV